MTFLELSKFFHGIGLWDGKQNSKYSFYPGAKPFDIKQYHAQFKEIGYLATSFLSDVAYLADVLRNEKSSFSNFFNPILDKGKDGYPYFTDKKLPPIIKIDVIIDNSEFLKIVEIDSYNPRGISYAMLLNECYQVGNSLLEQVIANELNTRKKETFTWLYADRERYYLPSLQYFKNHLHSNLNVEAALQNANDSEYQFAEDTCFYIAPWGLSKPNEIGLKRKLISHYESNPQNFIVPMKPWLHNKLLLALPYSERVQSFATDKQKTFASFTAMKKYLPITELVSKQTKIDTLNGNLILKEGVSSGHKGVFFNHSSEFETILNTAIAQKKPSFLLQEEVSQKRFDLEYFDNDGSHKQDTFYCRFIAHYDSFGQLLSVDLTGRTSPLVYGSIDSVQTACLW